MTVSTRLVCLFGNDESPEPSASRKPIGPTIVRSESPAAMSAPERRGQCPVISADWLRQSAEWPDPVGLGDVRNRDALTMAGYGALQPGQVGRKRAEYGGPTRQHVLCGADVGPARLPSAGRNVHSTGQVAGLSQRALIHLGRAG